MNTFDGAGAGARPPRAAAAAETLRRPREDALPDALITDGRYRDDGCDLFTACLSCPLPQCRYDVAGGARAMLNRVRDDEIRYLRQNSPCRWTRSRGDSGFRGAPSSARCARRRAAVHARTARDLQRA